MKISRWNISLIISCRHLHQNSKEDMDASGIVMLRINCLDCKQEIDRMFFMCGKYTSDTHKHYKDCL